MKNKLAILFLCFCAWTAPAYGQKGAPYFYGSGNAITNYAQVVALWTGCSGSQYLGYDGNCHTAAGSGTVTASGTPALYDFAYWTTAVNVTKVTAPTTKGTWYPCYVLATDAAAAPSDCLVGFSNPRAVTGTTSTDTILFSDNAGRVAYQGSVGVAVTMATATTFENPHYAVLLVNNTTGSATAVTVTTTTWQVNGAATLVIAQGQQCRLTVDVSGSAWDADCSESGLTAGTGITLTRAANGLTPSLTNTATTPNGQTCTLGSTCNVNNGAAQYSVAVNGAAGAAIQGAGPGAADYIFMGNDAGVGANPVFKAGPSGGTNGCAGTTDTTIYNTSTHAWGCHQIAAGGGGVSYGAGSASATAYVVTVSPAITSQPAGTAIIVLPGANNTTATTTLTANSLATMTITTCGQQALQAGDMVTTKDALFVSDGTYWQLQNPQRTRCGDVAYALGTVTTSATITPVNGFFQTVTLTAATACTFGFTQPTTGTVTITVVVNQAATPTGTAVWTSVLWPGGVVPVVTASASAVDIFSFKLDGTHIYGVAGQNFQ
jgi:hypothetical protein